MIPKVLIPSQILTTAAPTTAPYTYTSPTGGKGSYLDFVQFINYGTVVAKVTVNVVAASDVAGTQNVRMKAISIQPGASYPAPELTGILLNAGDYVSWFCDTATSINGFASGREL